jgi:hypothetical protein
VRPGAAGPRDAEARPLCEAFALVGSSGASVATTTMIEPAALGAPYADGTTL